MSVKMSSITQNVTLITLELPVYGFSAYHAALIFSNHVYLSLVLYCFMIIAHLR